MLQNVSQLSRTLVRYRTISPEGACAKGFRAQDLEAMNRSIGNSFHSFVESHPFCRASFWRQLAIADLD